MEFLLYFKINSLIPSRDSGVLRFVTVMLGFTDSGVLTVEPTAGRTKQKANTGTTGSVPLISLVPLPPRVARVSKRTQQFKPRVHNPRFFCGYTHCYLSVPHGPLPPTNYHMLRFSIFCSLEETHMPFVFLPPTPSVSHCPVPSQNNKNAEMKIEGETTLLTVSLKSLQFFMSFICVSTQTDTTRQKFICK